MIGDKTVAYAAAVHPCFEDLMQAAAQLAGLLVLNRKDPLLRRSAEEACQRAMDGLSKANVSASARLYHEHLLNAAARIKEAQRTSGDPLPLLKSADTHLRAAARALPGFQMVSFERACCA